MNDDSQHMRALKRANDTRRERAELKQGVESGDVDPVKVIRNPPRCVDTMSVIELLCSQRRWGKTRSRKLLKVVDLFEGRSIGALTVRQRRALADALAQNTKQQEL